MKIRPTNEVLSFSNRVREKTDAGDSHHGGHGGNFQDQLDQKKDEDLEKIQVTDKEITDAMDSFTHDQQAQLNGLKAEAMGKGPGLKVVLKDGSGAVIRQMTGEEFLKLRKTVKDGTAKVGKILDQKL